MQNSESGAGSRPVKSMTGFGRGRFIASGLEITTEIRAVNHRFLDIFLRVPKTYTLFEPEIRKIVSNSISRGKIDVTITRVGSKGNLMQMVLDENLSNEYYKCLVELRTRFGLAGDINLSDMLTAKDVIVPVEKEEAVELERPMLEHSLNEALAGLDKMRCAEGAALWRDIEHRLTAMRTTVAEIEPLQKQVPAAAKEKLLKRVQDLTGGLELDPDRLLQEVALIVDRSDVSEELTRLESHVDQFITFGKAGSPLGRKLDFLVQELNREANTIGSKSSSTDISSYVVDIKVGLEKIREQIQNIE